MILLTYPLPTASSPYQHPPLSIFYVGAYLENLGYVVEYWDARWDTKAQLTKLIEQATIVGVSSMSGYQLVGAINILKQAHALGKTTVLGGMHASLLPEQSMESYIDFIVCFEGEETMAELIKAIYTNQNYSSIPGLVWRDSWGKSAKIVVNPRRPLMNIDDVPSPITNKTLRYFRLSSESNDIMLQTSRGCCYKCITGDTIIHTIEGDFPIKELVGKPNVKVLSRDPITQTPVYAPAINICKVEEEAEIVRVYFDDGTHIDCTPDHKFKVFSYKNQYAQYINEYESDVEAQDLKPKQQVRAVRLETTGGSRVTLSTRRDIRVFRARVVMESILERPLLPDERVHHKDRQKWNDHPDNLVLTDKIHHASYHPEVAERMRQNNPAKNMTPEWRAKLIAATTGKRRSLEQRLRYRESKLGDKNPRYNINIAHDKENPSRIQELDVNHKVVNVESLPYREAVYCMEVPGINWFYANKVLIHNCGFCYSANQNERKWRPMKIEKFEEEIDKLLSHGIPVRRLLLAGDWFGPTKRILETAKVMHTRGIWYDLATRADTVTEEFAKELSGLNCSSLQIGIESGSPRVLKEIVNKQEEIADYTKCAEILSKYNIKAGYFIIRGLPTENAMERLASCAFADWLYAVHDGQCSISFFWYVPLPGTPLYKYEDDSKQPKTLKEWSHYSRDSSNPEALAWYWVSGLTFNGEAGGKTDKNFPGRRRLLIYGLEKMCRFRWKLRYFKHFWFEGQLLKFVMLFRVKHTGG